MNKIKITCDSTCDLTKELYKKYNIDVIPLSIILGNKVYKDGVDISAKNVFKFASKHKTLPKTSAVSIGEYTEFFKNFTDEGYSVIHINLSSELSSSFQNANIAASESKGKIYPIDSKNLSAGSGMLAILASELAQNASNAEEVVTKLEILKNGIDMSFVLQTLDYLKMGGRCSGVAAFGANALKLKPEIVVSNGTMTPHKKYRGDIEKSIHDYIKGALKDKEYIDLKRVILVHSCEDEEIVKKCVELTQSLYPFEEVLQTKAGCTISSHCGPNCLGLAFMKKDF